MTFASRATPAGPDPSGPDSLSIRDLYSRIDRALRGALPGQVWVAGEVRSFNVSSRGHCYIDLVDPVHARDDGTPVLKAVCWSSRWSRARVVLDKLGIVLEAGLVVRVRGEVQLYKPRGDISLIVSEIDTDALLGKVAAERARLVGALVDEGLFDRNRRIPVPSPPLRIGLVASPGTEGCRDFLGCLEASQMAFDVRLAPTQVQGRAAAGSVATSIRSFGAGACDLIVVVRGGGSKADLAVFDSEPVARAIAGSAAPVWTGIGHTGDQSVADEVAGRSFITPTECGQELARLAHEFWRSGIDAGVVAGRLAADQVARTDRSLDRLRHRAATGARSQLHRHADRLAHRAHSLHRVARGQADSHADRLAAKAGAAATSASRSFATAEGRLIARSDRLAALPARCLEIERLRTAQWRRLLGAYDYQHQLDRGYSVTRDGSGSVVRSAAVVERGTRLFTRLSDGEVVSEVTDSVAAGEDGRHDGGRP